MGDDWKMFALFLLVFVLNARAAMTNPAKVSIKIFGEPFLNQFNLQPGIQYVQVECLCRNVVRLIWFGCGCIWVDIQQDQDDNERK